MVLEKREEVVLEVLVVQLSSVGEEEGRRVAGGGY